MPPAGFEPTIPASEQPQTHALDGATAGITIFFFTFLYLWTILNRVMKKSNDILLIYLLRLILHTYYIHITYIIYNDNDRFKKVETCRFIKHLQNVFVPNRCYINIKRSFDCLQRLLRFGTHPDSRSMARVSYFLMSNAVDEVGGGGGVGRRFISMSCRGLRMGGYILRIPRIPLW